MSQTSPSYQSPFPDAPQVRTIVTPIALASLPAGGPATLLAASPPQALVIKGSFQVALSVSAGLAQVTPYAWIDSAWFPIGDDANTPKLVSANSAGVANAIGRFVSQADQTLTWAFVKTGTGTISYCSACGGEF